LKKKFLPVVVVVYDDARLIFWIKNCLESWFFDLDFRDDFVFLRLDLCLDVFWVELGFFLCFRVPAAV
jgi:hypothetical protein